MNNLLGNKRVKGYLERIVQQDTVHNSYLLSGPEGIGKSLFAEAFAQELLHSKNLEIHPDFRRYRPEGKSGSLSVETMREFREEVRQFPYQAKRKVFLLEDADRMQTVSANALLKTFEEPLASSVIILLAQDPQRLLPTILSRCCQIRFEPIPEEEIHTYLTKEKGIDASRAETIASLSNGSLGRALQLINEETEGSLRTLFLSTFSQGAFPDYPSLLAFVQKVASRLEKEPERDSSWKELSVHQRHRKEQEALGAQQTQLVASASRCFDLLLSWFRDLSLLQAEGSPSLLIHRDYQPALELLAKSATLPPLEQIQDKVERAKLHLSRSLPFPSCLETLLIECGFAK